MSDDSEEVPIPPDMIEALAAFRNEFKLRNGILLTQQQAVQLLITRGLANAATQDALEQAKQDSKKARE